MEQVLELQVMVYTDDLKGYFDTLIKNKSSLATFSQKFSNNVTIDKL